MFSIPKRYVHVGKGNLFVAKDGLDVGPHSGWVLASVNGGKDTLLVVVRHERGRHLVVRGQALLQCVGIVISALHERLAGDLCVMYDVRQM